MTDGSAAKDR